MDSMTQAPTPPPKQGQRDEAAWAYLVKDHPWVAKDPYYIENPTKCATYNAYLAGKSAAFERAADSFRECGETALELYYRDLAAPESKEKP